MSRRAGLPLLLCIVLAAGCSSDEPEPTATTPSTQLPSAVPSSPSPIIGDSYLDVDACVREERGGYPEVDCDDPRATARVLSRYLVEEDVTDLRGSECNDDTDLLVNMNESLRSLAARDPRGEHGYACLRNRRPPHPSDPGKGGGARLRVGDCVTVVESKLGSLTRLTLGSEVPCTRAKRSSTYFVVQTGTTSRYRQADCPGDSSAFTQTSLLGAPSAGPLDEVEYLCAEKR